jgi:signal transduction histidine kinase
VPTITTERQAPAPEDGPAADRGPRPFRGLVTAFAGIAVAFTVGLLAAHTFDGQIRSAAAEITGNSSPSISGLSEMRAALRQLQVGVDHHLETCAAGACARPSPHLAELQQELRAAWQQYQLLPTFPGEREIWPRLEANLDRLGGAVSAVIDPAGPPPDAAAAGRLRPELAPLFDRLDADVAAIIEIDHTSGRAVAERIDRLARLSTVAAVALDLTTVALTVVAGLLAVRLVRRYERTLQERAADLEQFAARVAHDVKGPLAATGAALHVARRLPPERIPEALERGERGVRRVQRLVDDLLEFARAGAAEPRRVGSDLEEVVEEVLAELRDVAEERKVEVRVENLAQQRVACSPGGLASIVGNLVRNAIAHMGESPVRVVRVRAPPSVDQRAVRIEVEDTGPGIPEAIATHVFEPFVRGAGPGIEGTGLGLATVKRFVDAHGGRVGFCARPDQPGTLFWLELPRGPARPEAPR